MMQTKQNKSIQKNQKEEIRNLVKCLRTSQKLIMALPIANNHQWDGKPQNLHPIKSRYFQIIFFQFLIINEFSIFFKLW